MNATDAAELRRASIRLAVQFAAVTLVLFAIVIAVTFAIVSASQTEAVNESLADAGMVDSPHDAPRNVLVAIRAQDQTVVSKDAPSWFPVTSLMQNASESEPPAVTSLTVDGQTYAIRTDADPGRVVQTAINTGENSEELGRLALGLIVAAALAVLGTGFIAAIMARRALRPMADALALQRRFVTDASHELRTPLTLLSTRAQLLRRQAAESSSMPISDGIDEILQDTRELTAILEDLLIAADPRESAEKVPVDVAAIADDAVASLQLDAHARGLTLSRAGTGEVVVVGVRTSLHRLYTALITNALEHARSSVVVSVEAVGANARIRVSDDGDGFAAAIGGRAFDRFATSRPQQSDHESSRHYGLGLALVAEVAAQHGGSVAVESTGPNTGATISVTLPRFLKP